MHISALIFKRKLTKDSKEIFLKDSVYFENWIHMSHNKNVGNAKEDILISDIK